MGLPNNKCNTLNSSQSSSRVLKRQKFMRIKIVKILNDIVKQMGSTQSKLVTLLKNIEKEMMTISSSPSSVSLSNKKQQTKQKQKNKKKKNNQPMKTKKIRKEEKEEKENKQYENYHEKNIKKNMYKHTNIPNLISMDTEEFKDNNNNRRKRKHKDDLAAVQQKKMKIEDQLKHDISTHLQRGKKRKIGSDSTGITTNNNSSDNDMDTLPPPSRPTKRRLSFNVEEERDPENFVFKKIRKF